jgi:hypothetical protein
MSLYLRGWIGIVAVTAMANTIQCFLNDQYPHQRIYALTDQATPLASRIYGTWTLLAAVTRLAFVASPNNQSICVATFASFAIAFGHFATEVFVYGTAPLCAGTILPLIVSSVSMLWIVLDMKQKTN